MASSNGMTLEQYIEKATDENKTEPDLTLNFALIDILQAKPKMAEEACKILKKRIKHKKYRVQILALTLLESLVKNCHATNSIVGNKDYQKTLFELATSKSTHQEVKDKLVDMIQTFAESFKDNKDLPLYEQTYINLKRKGIDFPLMGNASPAFIPPTAQATPSKVASKPQPQVVIVEGNYDVVEKEVQKSSVSDLYSNTKSTLDVLVEMLRAIDPSTEDVKGNDILQDLISNCKSSQLQLQELIQTGALDDSQMDKFLFLNDQVQQALDMHTKLLNGERVGPVQKKHQEVKKEERFSYSSDSEGETALRKRNGADKHPELNQPVPVLGAPPDKVVRRGKRGTDAGKNLLELEQQVGGLSLGNSPTKPKDSFDDEFAAIASRNFPTQPQPVQPQPFVQPTQPFVQPTQPFVQPTQPFVQPTQPFPQPTQPFVQPTQPFPTNPVYPMYPNTTAPLQTAYPQLYPTQPPVNPFYNPPPNNPYPTQQAYSPTYNNPFLTTTTTTQPQSLSPTQTQPQSNNKSIDDLLG